MGWYFRQEFKRYAIGVLCLLLVALVNLIPPKVIGALVDTMAKRNLTMDRLLLFLVALLFAGIGQYLFRYGWRNAIWGGAAKLEKPCGLVCFGIL